ncbi:hypothetical protein [Catelliglobosispora koreensis]|nr:hypothetical protein [Catelliglobosispora koreensis]
MSHVEALDYNVGNHAPNFVKNIIQRATRAVVSIPCISAPPLLPAPLCLS